MYTNEHKTTVIFGPPGTGKTTTLIDIFLEEYRKHWFKPEQFAFLTFTRKAANEARTRAIAKGVRPSEIPWFRTIHSLAYQCLGLTRDQVMSDSDYLELAGILGIYLTTKWSATGDGSSYGDKLMALDQASRSRGLDIRKVWESAKLERGVHIKDAERFQTTFHEFRKTRKKLDFIDILNVFAKRGTPPDIKVLIVDEAQDLSPIQWEVVSKISKNANKVFIAGDDDQSIYRWAGAEPATLIYMDGERRVLDKSYRVPRKIQAVAGKILSRVSVRQDKNWAPRQEDGSISYLRDIHQRVLEPGSHLLLARNKHQLPAYVEMCQREGYLYASEDIASKAVRTSVLDAISTWLLLKKKEPVTVEQALSLYAHMGCKKGYAYGARSALGRRDSSEIITFGELRKEYGLLHCDKASWRGVVENVTPAEDAYLAACLNRRPECLEEGVRIRIGTIHSSKGGEADHVTLMTDVSKKTYENERINPDDEHRVWYVGVTRAKQSLTVIHPSSEFSYRLPV